jgi:hypothetical protein
MDVDTEDVQRRVQISNALQVSQPVPISITITPCAIYTN